MSGFSYAFDRDPELEYAERQDRIAAGLPAGQLSPEAAAILSHAAGCDPEPGQGEKPAA